MNGLEEALKSSERVKNIPSNHLLEDHSRILTCSFPIRQTLKTAVCESDEYNDDTVTKNYR